MSAKTERLLWPDAAKGFCIFLVVLLHLTSKHYISMDWELPPSLAAGWQGLSLILAPIRMPLFFAISGFFVAKYITRSWGDVTRPRIAASYYLYAVWFTIHAVIFSFGFPLDTARVEGIGGFLLGLGVGYTSLWYLYALPIYFILSKLLARWPTTAIAVAGAVSVLAGSGLIPEIGNSSSLLGNFVFFAAAAYLPEMMTRTAENTSLSRTWLPSIGFGVTSAALIVMTYTMDNGSLMTRVGIGLFGFLTSLVAIIAGVKSFVWIANSAPSLARGCAMIGQRTLPVYVLHLPIIAIMNALLAGVALPSMILAVYPVVMSLAVIMLCLILHRVLLAVGGGWLFSLPTRSPQRTESMPQQVNAELR